ncbi:glycosyltransferase family 39 protein [Candidatus Woesearchaeota archaeon]|nr:glycosyltransferase family 39 protein [Candidatus Woesearchaeota archaeon]
MPPVYDGWFLTYGVISDFSFKRGNKMAKNIRKKLIILLFIVFVFLRIFSDDPDIYMNGDFIKYIAMGKHFPYHTTFNNQVEINHGPFFPYIINLFTHIVQKDYIAAILISFLSACATFFIIYHFFMMLTNNFNISYTVLIFYTLSDELIISSKVGLKESFVVMLMMSALYYYAKGVKYGEKGPIFVSSILSGLVGITVDHVIFIIPSFMLSYIFLNYKKIDLRKFSFPGLGYAMIPIIAVLLSYGAWTGVKAYLYSTNYYYPAGVAGAPVATNGFGLMELINPRAFNETDPMLPAGFTFRARDYAFNLGYIFNVQPFRIPRALNLNTMNYLLEPKHIIYMLDFYIPLALIVLYFLFKAGFDFIKTKKIYGNIDLYVVGLFLIFVSPITQKVSSPRYIYMAYIFMYYFIAKGLVSLFMKFKANKLYPKILFIVAILLLLLIPVWYFNHKYFIFSYDEPIYYYAQNTADYIIQNFDKDDVVFAHAGIIYQLIYLTDNRFVGIPPKSDNLLELVEYYGIDYIIFDRYYAYDYYHYSLETVEFVKNHPEKFEFVAKIDEEGYQRSPENSIKPDEVYIYKVLKGGKNAENGVI